MNAPAKVPRQMRCTCCGHTKPRKGCKTTDAGLVCAECVPELPAPALPKLKGRPPAESREPYRGYALQSKPNAPGQAARDAAIPPGVKVTVRPAPRGRFEVPADFRGGFMAEWDLLREGGRA